MDVATQLVDAPVQAIELAGAGRNGRVYRITSKIGTFAMKFYPLVAEDHCDRLSNEFAAFAFLHGVGVTATPRALARLDEHRAALFEWIDGHSVEKPTDSEVREAARFLKILKDLAQDTTPEAIGNATEASLSGKELINQVERRLACLKRVVMPQTDIANFLNDALAPSIQARIENACDGYEKFGIDITREIPQHARTLSPSDFGFHNAIRRDDGTLAFVDFEYFGWDDPVRAVSDLVFHPAMALLDHQRQFFIDDTFQVFGVDNDFPIRLRLLYPLVVLRWCLILLNEFLPGKLERRMDRGAESHDAIRCQQLVKAQSMLARINEPLTSPNHAS